MCMVSGNYDSVIIGGDLNVDLGRNTANCRFLKQFAECLDLQFA